MSICVERFNPSNALVPGQASPSGEGGMHLSAAKTSFEAKRGNPATLATCNLDYSVTGVTNVGSSWSNHLLTL